MLFVYGKPNCPRCFVLCRMLKHNKVEHTYLDITQEENKEFSDFLKEKNIEVLPVIKNGDEIISDYNEILAIYK